MTTVKDGSSAQRGADLLYSAGQQLENPTSTLPIIDSPGLGFKRDRIAAQVDEKQSVDTPHETNLQLEGPAEEDHAQDDNDADSEASSTEDEDEDEDEYDDWDSDGVAELTRSEDLALSMENLSPNSLLNRRVQELSVKSDIAHAEKVAKSLDRREHLSDLTDAEQAQEQAANDKPIAELLQRDCEPAQTEW